MSEKAILKSLFIPNKITYTLPIDKNDMVLIISPHPDDETLGCGGTIIKMCSGEINVAVVMLTDGNGGGRTQNIGSIRKKEFVKARDVLGYKFYSMLDYPDGKLQSFKTELSKQIHELILEKAPKLVLIPYLLDCVVDHQTANIVLSQVLRNVDATNMIIGMYEIWTPIINPNCYLNITNEYQKKSMAMKCYQTQENYYGIIDKANALSTFRAKLSMRRKIKHMECFKLLGAKEYVRLVEEWNKFQIQGGGCEI